jgi:hypothetical protein
VASRSMDLVAAQTVEDLSDVERALVCVTAPHHGSTRLER